MKTNLDFSKEIKQTESIDELKRIYKEHSDVNLSFEAKVQEMHNNAKAIYNEIEILENEYGNYSQPSIKNRIITKIGNITVGEINSLTYL